MTDDAIPPPPAESGGATAQSHTGSVSQTQQETQQQTQQPPESRPTVPLPAWPAPDPTQRLNAQDPTVNLRATESPGVTAPPAPETPHALVPVDASEAPPMGLWDKMKADPQYAPEHLALEAVRRLGPEAKRWAEETRARYPAAPVDGMAQMARKKFVDRARISGAASGAAGLPGAVLDMGFLAWTQARMVLHIAAAYGVDPTHPDRATDLLVLQKVHKVAEGARLALAVAAGRESAGALWANRNTPLGRALARLSLKLAQMAGMRAVKRVAAKVVPGAAIVLGAWANASATRDLAERTIQLYRPATAPQQWPPPPGTQAQ